MGLDPALEHGPKRPVIGRDGQNGRGGGQCAESLIEGRLMLTARRARSKVPVDRPAVLGAEVTPLAASFGWIVADAHPEIKNRRFELAVRRNAFQCELGGITHIIRGVVESTCIELTSRG